MYNVNTNRGAAGSAVRQCRYHDGRGIVRGGTLFRWSASGFSTHQGLFLVGTRARSSCTPPHHLTRNPGPQWRSRSRTNTVSTYSARFCPARNPDCKTRTVVPVHCTSRPISRSRTGRPVDMSVGRGALLPCMTGGFFFLYDSRVKNFWLLTLDSSTRS